jgi:hypothetical protein
VAAAGQEGQGVEEGDQGQQPAVSDDEGQILQDAADHRAEEVGTERRAGIGGIAEPLGEDHVGQEDGREGDDHRHDEAGQR